MNNQHDSTYALLIRSEEKSRGVMEALLYGLIALSTVISICQFARQPSPLPNWRAERDVGRASDFKADCVV